MVQGPRASLSWPSAVRAFVSISKGAGDRGKRKVETPDAAKSAMIPKAAFS
jgi:hypothetical protein